MTKLTRLIPSRIQRTMILLYNRLANKMQIDELIVDIDRRPDLNDINKLKLKQLLAYGERFIEYVNEYCDCDLQCYKNWKTQSNSRVNPICICVQKDDILRTKLLVQYYRKLGIRNFAFLDDHSTDGSLEYLESLDDIRIYKTEKSYTTARRQVWINKIIEDIGYNRWYLIIDSDEFLDYSRSDTISIEEFVKQFDALGKRSIKVLLLDLLAEDSLYSNRVINDTDIFKYYNLFWPKYSYNRTPYCVSFIGGARKLLDPNSNPLVSKYPLLCPRESDIAINSHFNYPFTLNSEVKACAVLKHYKFLPGDRKKYRERADKKSFQNGSIEYKKYMSDEFANNYISLVNYMTKYTNYESTNIITVLNRGEIR